MNTHRIAGLVLFALPLVSASQDLLADGSAKSDAPDLAEMSLQELMNMDVTITSVSKKDTRLFTSPAAVAVVTQEDIRRLGVTTLPEALRLVPGMDVARINVGTWAVSTRGFNGEHAGQLLVLIDGRSVYTPESGGVFWDAQDVVMEDVDRIEVIRGPGAALWGANAVNGVINIVTKSAADTQGTLFAMSMASTEDTPAATARYGGRFGPNLNYRVYAKYFDAGSLPDSAGRDTSEKWNMLHGGFRADWVASAPGKLTLQGDYYSSNVGRLVDLATLSPATVTPTDGVSHNSGGNLLGRWTRTFSPASSLTLQTYFDRTIQGDGFGKYYGSTYDLDAQYRLALGSRHDVVWGGGYRYTALTFTNSTALTWTAAGSHLELFNLFVQDDITLAPNRVHLTLGSKFEHNSFTGLEVQPSARLLWTPADNQTWWASVSRATRTPSAFSRNSQLNGAAFQPPMGPPILISVIGNPQLKVESLKAYELGYRIEPAEHLSFDFAGFYNRYSDLIAVVPGSTSFVFNPAPPHVLITRDWQNAGSGETYGAELSMQWQVNDRLSLAGSYTWLVPHVTVILDESPQHQYQLRSYLQLAKNWELNGAAYYVDAITPASGGSSIPLPSYVRCDLGIMWRPTAALQVGVWGQNLLDHRHTEFATVLSTQITQIPRSVLGKATWNF